MALQQQLSLSFRLHASTCSALSISSLFLLSASIASSVLLVLSLAFLSELSLASSFAPFLFQVSVICLLLTWFTFLLLFEFLVAFLSRLFASVVFPSRPSQAILSFLVLLSLAVTSIDLFVVYPRVHFSAGLPHQSIFASAQIVSMVCCCSPA